MNDPRRQAAEEWARRLTNSRPEGDSFAKWGDVYDAHLAGQECGEQATLARLREYQRALLWCYGWINEAMWMKQPTPERIAGVIEDDKWNKVGALVGEASDEVDP